MGWITPCRWSCKQGRQPLLCHNIFLPSNNESLEQVQDESIDIFVNVTVQHSHEVNIQIIKFRMHFYCIDLNHWPGICWMSRARYRVILPQLVVAFVPTSFVGMYHLGFACKRRHLGFPPKRSNPIAQTFCRHAFAALCNEIGIVTYLPHLRRTDGTSNADSCLPVPAAPPLEGRRVQLLCSGR